MTEFHEAIRKIFEDVEVFMILHAKNFVENLPYDAKLQRQNILASIRNLKLEYPSMNNLGSCPEFNADDTVDVVEGKADESYLNGKLDTNNDTGFSSNSNRSDYSIISFNNKNNISNSGNNNNNNNNLIEKKCKKFFKKKCKPLPFNTKQNHPVNDRNTDNTFGTISDNDPQGTISNNGNVDKSNFNMKSSKMIKMKKGGKSNFSSFFNLNYLTSTSSSKRKFLITNSNNINESHPGNYDVSDKLMVKPVSSFLNKNDNMAESESKCTNLNRCVSLQHFPEHENSLESIDCENPTSPNIQKANPPDHFNSFQSQSLENVLGDSKPSNILQGLNSKSPSQGNVVRTDDSPTKLNAILDEYFSSIIDPSKSNSAAIKISTHNETDALKSENTGMFSEPNKLPLPSVGVNTQLNSSINPSITRNTAKSDTKINAEFLDNQSLTSSNLSLIDDENINMTDSNAIPLKNSTLIRPKYTSRININLDEDIFDEKYDCNNNNNNKNKENTPYHHFPNKPKDMHVNHELLTVFEKRRNKISSVPPVNPNGPLVKTNCRNENLSNLTASAEILLDCNEPLNNFENSINQNKVDAKPPMIEKNRIIVPKQERFRLRKNIYGYGSLHHLQPSDVELSHITPNSRDGMVRTQENSNINRTYQDTLKQNTYETQTLYRQSHPRFAKYTKEENGYHQVDYLHTNSIDRKQSGSLKNKGPRKGWTLPENDAFHNQSQTTDRRLRHKFRRYETTDPGQYHPLHSNVEGQLDNEWDERLALRRPYQHCQPVVFRPKPHTNMPKMQYNTYNTGKNMDEYILREKDELNFVPINREDFVNESLSTMTKNISINQKLNKCRGPKLYNRTQIQSYSRAPLQPKLNGKDFRNLDILNDSDLIHMSTPHLSYPAKQNLHQNFHGAATIYTNKRRAPTINNLTPSDLMYDHPSLHTLHYPVNTTNLISYGNSVENNQSHSNTAYVSKNTPMFDDELILQPGEPIYITNRKYDKLGWWMAVSLISGERGLVPKQHVSQQNVSHNTHSNTADFDVEDTENCYIYSPPPNLVY